MRRIQYFGGILVAAIIAVATPVFAANEGKAVGVDPDAVAEADGADRVLVAGADISVGERIVTGASGKVQIIFADQTRLVVGPGSALVIEAYLLRGTDSVEQVSIAALSGTFRFITGRGPKEAYTIKTPNGTIGVRGTAFDLTVAPAFGTLVLLLHGAVRVCDSAGNCTELTNRCDLGSVAPATGAILLEGPARSERLDAFPYAQFQSQLLAQFRVNGANGCVVPQAVATDGSLAGAGEPAPQRQPGPKD